MISYKSLILCFFVTVYAAVSWAEYEPGKSLSGYEPSYLMYAADDESHVEFKISIKYPLRECPKGDCDTQKDQVYFAYTGKYDFYIYSEDTPGRESAPIISRVQNPGIYYRRLLGKDSWDYLQSFSIGWFHESNGQQITELADFNNTLHAEDFVSRGWDYLGVDIKFSSPLKTVLNDDHLYYLRLRAFCNCQAFGKFSKEDDTSIFGSTEGEEIGDYDGLRLLMKSTSGKNYNYTLSLRSGVSTRNAFSNLTVQLEYTYDYLGIPWSILYFNGYGKDISTYHIKDEYVGVGVKIW